MGTSNGERLAELCEEIEELTDTGNEALNLEGLDAEEVKRQLIWLSEGADNLLMVVSGTVRELGLTLPAKVSA